MTRFLLERCLDVVDIDGPDVRMALKPWDIHKFKRLVSK